MMKCNDYQKNWLLVSIYLLLKYIKLLIHNVIKTHFKVYDLFCDQNNSWNMFNEQIFWQLNRYCYENYGMGNNFIKAPCYLYYLLNVSSVEISLFICGVPHRKSSVEVHDMVWLTMNLLSCLLPLTFVHKVKKYHKNSWKMSDFQVWSWPIPTLF